MSLLLGLRASAAPRSVGRPAGASGERTIRSRKVVLLPLRERLRARGYPVCSRVAGEVVVAAETALASGAGGDLLQIDGRRGPGIGHADRVAAAASAARSTVASLSALAAVAAGI